MSGTPAIPRLDQVRELLAGIFDELGYTRAADEVRTYTQVAQLRKAAQAMDSLIEVSFDKALGAPCRKS